MHSYAPKVFGESSREGTVKIATFENTLKDSAYLSKEGDLNLIPS